MKKLQVLTAAGAILLALAGPSLAAQRAHRGVDAYASGDVNADRSGAYYYGPQTYYGAQPLTPAQHQYSRAPYAGQNLPYPDRPYGDPDSW
jgi:hypothetical protein